jgi:hypothetical protein
MPQFRPPSMKSLGRHPGQRPRAGYIRSDATHKQCEWIFEVWSEEPRVSGITILTGDGPLHVGLNRADAMNLAQKLRLFLLDWPEDQAKS